MFQMRKILACIAFLLMAPQAMAETQTATFAGGCFWCMDAEFAEVPGVTKVVSGYTGGTVANPTYEQVSSGATGHVESIEVTFDPSKVTYKQLVTIFWENVDPTDPDGQFCDKGSQYRAEIFYHDADQQKIAEESKAKVEKSFGQPIAAVIRPAAEFYPAEEYHQDFYKKSKAHYEAYHAGCGRAERLQELWNGKPKP